MPFLLSLSLSLSLSIAPAHAEAFSLASIPQSIGNFFSYIFKPWLSPTENTTTIITQTLPTPAPDQGKGEENSSLATPKQNEGGLIIQSSGLTKAEVSAMITGAISALPTPIQNYYPSTYITGGGSSGSPSGSSSFSGGSTQGLADAVGRTTSALSTRIDNLLASPSISGLLSAVNGSFSGDLSVSGNLTVTGTQSLSGALGASYFTASDATATSTFAGGLQAGGSSGLYVLQNGNVGIGTTSPTQTLDVNGSVALPATTNSSSGIIYKGTTSFIHNYAVPTSAGRNTFVGLGSGNFTMSPGGGDSNLASYNTIVGWGALASDTTGYANSALGDSALAANTTGLNNTAIGHFAMQYNTEGISNTAVGAQALWQNTTGNTNVAVGDCALCTNTTGTQNVGVGDSALEYNTTGVNNTALGHGALAFNTTASYNTAVGESSLFVNTTGASNVAVGYGALKTNTTGTSNVAVGVFALGKAVSAGSNVAVGVQALSENTTGQHQVAVGANALAVTTTGTYNTAVGDGVMALNVDGFNNAAFGNAALGSNTSGYYNVAVGSSLQGNTSGHSNTGVGFLSGGANTTGSFNTYIGRQANNANATQRSYMTVIGAQATGDCNNCVILGRTGDNVGIGTTSPLAKLDVAGANNGTSPLFQLSSVASFATTTRLIVLNNGNVGIGTTTPTLGPLTMNSGAYVTTGGVWTNASDRNSKENFATMTPADILAKINALPITEWNYKTEGSAVKHIGPVAQDFYSLFGLGNNNTSISTIDPAGVALLGIQALSQRIDQLSSSTPRGTFIDKSSLSDTLGYFAGQTVDGVVHFGQVVVDKITATLGVFHQVRTDELCVGSTCVSETEFKALLHNNGISPAASVPAASPTVEMGTQTATTSAPEIATSTPSTQEKNTASTTPASNDASQSNSATSTDSITEGN